MKLTTQQAAVEKGVSIHTIRLWIQRGWLPVTRFGNAVQVDSEVLMGLARRPVGRPRGTV